MTRQVEGERAGHDREATCDHPQPTPVTATVNARGLMPVIVVVALLAGAVGALLNRGVRS